MDIDEAARRLEDTIEAKKSDDLVCIENEAEARRRATFACRDRARECCLARVTQK